MASQEDDAQPPLWGPINLDRKRPELVDIATALDLRFGQKANKPTLVKLIREHIGAHPELAKEKRFQGLFAYRPDKQAAKPAPKSAADRDAEDAVEASKEGKPETGALKTLLDKAVPRDPPARSALLNVTRPTRSSVRHIHQPLAVEEAETPEATSVPTSESPSKSYTPLPDAGNTSSSAGVEGSADKEESAFWADSEDAQETFSALEGVPDDSEKVPSCVGLQKAHIIVAFQGMNGPADEVHIPDNVRLKTKTVKYENGNERVVVDLSELLPVAMEHASTPMKNRRARLLRPGVTASTNTQAESVVDIGSLSAFTSGERLKYLTSDHVNKYTLEPMPEDVDTLVCRLFVRDEKSPSNSETQRSKPVLREAPGAIASSTETTTMSQTMSTSPSSAPQVAVDEFQVWLRELLGAPKNGWGRGTLIENILPRVKAIRDAVKKVSDLGWERSQGGYEVADNYAGAGLFVGRRFKKEDIIKALQIGHTSAHQYEQLFNLADMSKIPELQEWYDDPTGPQAETFKHMKMAAFVVWRDKRMKPRRLTKLNAKASSSSSSKRKQQDEEYESDEDESDVETRKKPKKVRRRFNSESLDD